jgi:pyrroline-5-carboxylate reductase
MIAFIGGGNMAEALIKGIVRKGKEEIIVSEPREERRKYLKGSYKVKTTSSNIEAVKSADIIILAVKPQIMETILNEISESVNGSKAVVSIAAGIRLSYLAERLKAGCIIRVMPNTPALVGEGISVISMCECVHGPEMAVIKDIFMSVGRVMMMPEKYMDQVTALSGSGPAFIAYFLEGMIEGAVHAGLPEESARELALQTAFGTLKMLEEGMSTKKLREMVTSPGGTTAAALNALDEREFKLIVHLMMEAAVKRAAELGKG